MPTITRNVGDKDHDEDDSDDSYDDHERSHEIPGAAGQDSEYPRIFIGGVFDDTTPVHKIRECAK